MVTGPLTSSPHEWKSTSLSAGNSPLIGWNLVTCQHLTQSLWREASSYIDWSGWSHRELLELWVKSELLDPQG